MDLHQFAEAVLRVQETAVGLGIHEQVLGQHGRADGVPQNRKVRVPVRIPVRPVAPHPDAARGQNHVCLLPEDGGIPVGIRPAEICVDFPS